MAPNLRYQKTISILFWRSVGWGGVRFKVQHYIFGGCASWLLKYLTGWPLWNLFSVLVWFNSITLSRAIAWTLEKCNREPLHVQSKHAARNKAKCTLATVHHCLHIWPASVVCFIGLLTLRDQFVSIASLWFHKFFWISPVLQYPINFLDLRALTVG